MPQNQTNGGECLYLNGRLSYTVFTAREKEKHLPQRQLNNSNKVVQNKMCGKYTEKVTNYWKFRTLQYTEYKEEWKRTKGRSGRREQLNKGGKVHWTTRYERAY